MNTTDHAIADESENENSVAVTSSYLISLLILCIIVLLYGMISYKLYKKNQFDMEPMHVFQLNFMIVSTLRIIFPALSVLDQLIGFKHGPVASCLYYFPIFFAYLSFNTDLVLMQVDRFLAVYWNMKYSSHVTYKLALRCCIGSKVFATLVTFLVAILDPEYSKCEDEYSYIHLKDWNIYLDAYPKLAVALLLVAVSTYMAITMIRLENKVKPMVVLPIVPTVSIDIEEQENSRTQRNNKKYKVKRNIEDPYMFDKVQLQETQIETTNEKDKDKPVQRITPPAPKSEKFLIAKRALTMSLITLVLFSIIIPNSIIAIIHKYSGDCGTYLWQYRIGAPLRIISHFLHQGLLLKKIDKI